MSLPRINALFLAAYVTVGRHTCLLLSISLKSGGLQNALVNKKLSDLQISFFDFESLTAYGFEEELHDIA